MVRKQEIVKLMTPTPRGSNFVVKRVKLMYFVENLLLYSRFRQTKYSYDEQERVYQNCKFHEPRGRSSCAKGWPYKSYVMKMHSLKISFLFSELQTRQTKYIVVMIKEGSTQIVNFMNTGAVVLVLRRGHKSHI